MQGEKIEAWFVSQARRQYFGAESPQLIYMPTNSQKNVPTGKMS